MILVIVPWAVCMSPLQNLYASTEVGIWQGTMEIPTLNTGVLFRGQWLEYLPEYFIQHLSGWLPLLIQAFHKRITMLEWNWEGSDCYNAVHCGHLEHLWQ
jgi:hypothetical protein